MNVIQIFVLSLLLGRFGSIRLGGEGARPEFSAPSWLAMLFSAGGDRAAVLRCHGAHRSRACATRRRLSTACG
jgi:hypothetical protein